MPSREEMYFLTMPPSAESDPAATVAQDFLSRDIENLVCEIKQNLRLSAGLKSRHQRRLVRPSPYSNPSRSLSDYCELCSSAAAAAKKAPPAPYDANTFTSSSCSSSSSSGNNNTSTRSTCPHRTITNMSILKDAPTSDDPYEMLQHLLRGGDLIKEAVRRLQKGLSPKQRYYYDSDEEASRSPLRIDLDVFTDLEV